MSKSEFLYELEEALRGEVSEAVIQENLRYYQRYIEEEVKKGNSEENVISMLGSGRIIAKTVIEAHGNGQENTQGYTHFSESDNHSQETAKSQNGITWKTKIKWGAAIAAILFVIIAILGVIMHVVWALLPFILLGFAVYYLLKK